jgi:endogenous inhibitor of DNA gyrase (YacG/DUF329 family)
MTKYERQLMHEIRKRLSKIEVLLRPTRPCPHCGHPVISAPFCEDTPVECPDCGEHSVWTFRDGKYRLEKNAQP